VKLVVVKEGDESPRKPAPSISSKPASLLPSEGSEQGRRVSTGVVEQIGEGLDVPEPKMVMKGGGRGSAKAGTEAGSAKGSGYTKVEGMGVWVV
jgi:hypothetical protein